MSSLAESKGLPLDRRVWWLAAGLGAVLGAGAVLVSPLWLVAGLAAVIGLAALLRAWPQASLLLLMVAALITRYRVEIGVFTLRAEQVAVLIAAGLLAWLIIFHSRRFAITLPGMWALGWWLANLLATLFHAPDKLDSAKHLFRLGLMVLTYLVMVNLLRTRQQWQRAFTWFLVLGVAEALFGIIARALYPFGINLGVQVAWVLKEPVPYGTLEEGNIFGSHAVSWFLCLFLLFLACGRFRDRRRLWWTMGLAITALAALLSFSRGAWLSLVAGLLPVFLYYSARPRIQRQRCLMLVLVGPLLFLTLAVIMALVPLSIPLVDRLRTFSELATDSTFVARLGNYALAAHDWLQHPWLGWGPGTFYQLHGLIRYAPAWISNQTLRTLQETGVLGLVLFAGYVVSVLWVTVRASRRVLSRADRAALLGLAVGFFALQVAYQATDGTWIAAPWVHAGLLVAGARLLGRPVAEDHPTVNL